MKLSKSIIFTVFLFSFSCFEDIPNINLIITNSDWSAIITEDGVGEVHMNIVGSTDANNVTVKTYGDGVITDYTLTLDANKNFNEDIIISFTHAPDTNIVFKSATVVTAYKDDGTKEIKLESPDLNYLPIDCCN
jgi:hypothetical protein